MRRKWHLGEIYRERDLLHSHRRDQHVALRFGRQLISSLVMIWHMVLKNKIETNTLKHKFLALGDKLRPER